VTERAQALHVVEPSAAAPKANREDVVRLIKVESTEGGAPL